MGNDDGNESTPRPNSEADVTLGNVTKMAFNSRAHEIQAGLIDTFLNLELVDNNLYLARHLLKGRKSSPAVYGGQVIGQALAAAASTVGEGFIPNSLHSYFLKCGDVNRPILYMIDRIRDGRSFCTRLVKAVQQGEAIFTMQMSFHKPEPDGIVYQQKMPAVPPPEELQDMRQIIETALVDNDLPAASRAMLTFKLNEIPPAFERVFQFRPVDPNKVLLKGNCEEPTSAVWLKANENIGDDPRLHQCVATYISDSTLIETAMRPAIASGFVPSMALSLDHTVWMHDPNFRVDEWMLYENTSTISKLSSSRFSLGAFVCGEVEFPGYNLCWWIEEIKCVLGLKSNDEYFQEEVVLSSRVDCGRETEDSFSLVHRRD
ncbi:hypothetical protein PENTCL1PPCAC_2647 [Pristionchus entomophagus]|uniref:Acyl-CoA thioesterase II n=1 Tax=Pristionchus entomophagus TaxID=358040 RepID=A0AAV5SB10_9BILA|nr:hypothetical protein PENTCL1PPCAC_2647 [Pristionchus entomophagus]